MSRDVGRKDIGTKPFILVAHLQALKDRPPPLVPLFNRGGYERMKFAPLLFADLAGIDVLMHVLDRLPNGTGVKKSIKKRTQ